MIEKYRITHFLPLVAILIATVIGFVLFSYDRALKLALLISAGIAYFVWGLIHHYIHKDLSIEIALEYLIISAFGVSAILFLIF
jgi:uncharacterized membrane protein